MTSGDLCSKDDADFIGYRYEEKVPYCLRNVSYETKTEIYQEYGIPQKCRGEYTVDHFIPLALGGSNDKMNLWPEHKRVKATRQNLEIELYYQLRRGEITHEAAMAVIADAKMNPPAVDPTDCH
ncbi:MAG TPA: HNH endonuclease signature motif containing protein [Bdellovibrionales bacterium]|nr:HNH endonuclease signature motif containing protein [Bdellovibrionales bacterium]